MKSTNFTRRTLVLATLATMAVGSTAFAEDLLVKIGFAGPLTGASGHQGVDQERGVRIALEEANAKQLKINGNTVKFQIQSEDDQGDPKVATGVAQRLVDSKVAAVIGHYGSGASIPASRIYGDAGIPQISASSSNPVLTSQGIKSVFRVIISDDQMGQYAGSYVVKSLKAKRIVLIDNRTAYGQGAADEIGKAIKKEGGNIVMREFTSDKVVDFTSLLTAVKAANADAIIFVGEDFQAAPMAKQIKALGLKAAFMPIGGLTNDTFIKMAGESGEGTLSWDYGLPIENMPKGKEFDQKMKSKFGTGVIQFAPLAYDATWAVINAMVKANSADPKKYLAAMKTNKFQGLSGPIEFTAKGDLKQAAATLYTLKGGQWKVLEVKYGQ
ncbi:branched-chain amino acid ABC transporter substrate-binding protein [Leeia sp. TBRC 13508]|uniref:Branched-chain amino acid ABC transporter substrate-binding protein n=1 Tax=Leeia speluncae TaxID=2884804 RepID=A0ABS8D9Y7_9NEIS|nr:branched-chain amino acid ABC transporter substrate-binding protein [Leeia speluncae]MCB6185017.1 branched-chain amino acid ABC transporter substrate-binding protein [Leeia speluncae]